jgi:hypothetical protein
MVGEVLPAFTVKYHIPAQYAGGNPTDQVARMALVKANPQSDVFISDDGPMYRAIDLGLCGKVEPRLTAGVIDSAHTTRTTGQSASACSPAGFPTTQNTSPNTAGPRRRPGTTSTRLATRDYWRSPR